MALPDNTAQDAATYKANIDQELSEIDEVMKRGNTASAVNEITITNAATGNAPGLGATGTDTDVPLNLEGKGVAGVNQLNMPLFRAYANTYYAHAANALVRYDTVDFDVTNDFTTGTYRFTPSKSGYYFFNVAVRSESFASGALLSLVLQKNGSAIKYSLKRQDSGSTQTMTMEISDMVYMNGTTDYVDVKLETACQIINGSTATSFMGYRVNG